MASAARFTVRLFKGDNGNALYKSKAFKLSSSAFTDAREAIELNITVFRATARATECNPEYTAWVMRGDRPVARLHYNGRSFTEYHY